VGDAVEHVNLGTIPLMRGFITISGIVGMLIVGAIPKWALLAPVFVPLFMKLGVAPRLCWRPTEWAIHRPMSSPR
jgi:aminobenzoyl-glutamate transport protein